MSARDLAAEFSHEHFRALAARGLFYSDEPVEFFTRLQKLTAESLDLPLMLSLGMHWRGIQVLRRTGQETLADSGMRGLEFFAVAHEELIGQTHSDVQLLQKSGALNLAHATGVVATMQLNGQEELIFVRPKTHEVTNLARRQNSFRTASFGKMEIAYPLLRSTSLELGSAEARRPCDSEFARRIESHAALGLLQGLNDGAQRPSLRALELVITHVQADDLELLSTVVRDALIREVAELSRRRLAENHQRDFSALGIYNADDSGHAVA